jgi:two-component system cell cycle sensor histidine kinase/response regulator CckA
MPKMKKTNNTDGKTDKDLKNPLKRLHDLEGIIDRGPVIYCIWRFHEDAPVEYISTNIEQWGYKPEDFLSGGLSWYGITHPEDVSRLRSEILTNIKNKVWQFDQSYRILDSKGEIRWVEDQTVFIVDKDGKITHAQGAILDVTDRKKTQAALKESESIYQAVFENTGTAMAIAAADRTILLGNDEIEKLTGYTKEEVTSNSFVWESFIAPHDLDRLRGYNRLRLTDPAHAPKQYEFQIMTKSGALKDVLMTTGLIPGTKKTLVSIIDITDRKKAELELQKSEERFQELLHNSSDITVVIDEKGILKYVSPSVKRILNYDEKDMLGKSGFDFIHPDDIKSSADALQKVAASENKGVAAEFRFRHQNGSWVHLEALGNNCLANPAISGIIINCRDVTDRRRMETRLMQSQKMEAIGTLAGGIAHDFNNLLMGIQGYVSLMLLRKAPADPDFDKLNSVQNLVQSGADLTSKLLGFARGGQYEVRPTDLNELISKTVNIFGRTKKEITIHQKYAKNLWTAEVDRNQIEQVLINIYVNAWQAMTGDGGDIYIETDNAAISENDAHLLNIKAGDYVRITITDTGSGMDKEICRRVFEPFFTTKDKSRGAGLSLASAYGIIKEHSGAIEVESEPGQGTIVSLYFPASVKEILKETAGPKEIVKGMETILLVDDEEAVLDVCKELLISMGYSVLSAGNGKEALSIYETNKNGIDLVMLDMIMPGFSGGDTYDALKLINPQVKVMLSTGYSISEQAKKIMGKGCQALIQKPFRLDDLSQKVREVLEMK